MIRPHKLEKPTQNLTARNDQHYNFPLFVNSGFCIQRRHCLWDRNGFVRKIVMIQRNFLFVSYVVFMTPFPLS